MATMFQMTKEAQENVDASAEENKSEGNFLPSIRLAYPNSAVCTSQATRNMNLEEEGQPAEPILYPGKAYIYDGKDENELSKHIKVQLPVSFVLVAVKGNVEAWKGITPKIGDKEIIDEVTVPFDPNCIFVRTPEYKDFASAVLAGDKGEGLVTKLSHTVLIFDTEKKEFFEVYFKHSTTDDYTKLMSYIGEEGGEILLLNSYTQEIGKGANKSKWHRFRVSSTGEIFEGEMVGAENACERFFA